MKIAVSIKLFFLYFRVDRENLVTGPKLTVIPAPCEICVASRVEAEREDRLKYSGARVFVRRILPESANGLGISNQHDPEFCDSPSELTLIS